MPRAPPLPSPGVVTAALGPPSLPEWFHRAEPGISRHAVIRPTQVIPGDSRGMLAASGSGLRNPVPQLHDNPHHRGHNADPAEDHQEHPAQAPSRHAYHLRYAITSPAALGVMYGTPGPPSPDHSV